LVLTGRADEQSQIDVLEGGADDYLSKPFHRGVLLARAANLVLRHRAEQRASRLTAELDSLLKVAAEQREALEKASNNEPAGV
jgi:DNA-binding response OmpR family regulator